MKSYTDLEQSKRLTEILPLESADHHYVRKTCDFMGNSVDGKWSEPKYGNSESSYAHYAVQNFTSYEKVPCWSLAALLSVLPKDEGIECSISFGYYNSKGEYIEKWLCAFEKEGETTDDFIIETIDADNPVDACVEMIIKLKEKGLL